MEFQKICSKKVMSPTLLLVASALSNNPYFVIGAGDFVWFCRFADFLQWDWTEKSYFAESLEVLLNLGTLPW